MKSLLTIFISIALTLNSFCQISEGGQPYSYSHQNTTTINQTTIAAPSKRKIQSKITDDKSSYCVGVILPCYLNPSNSGTWISHLDGSRSWLLKINSPNAIGLTLSYKNLKIPKGAELFLYNENKTHTIGKFSSSRNIQNPITHTQVRESKGKNPLRLVIDPNLKLNLDSNVFNSQSKTIIVNQIKNQSSKHLIYLKIQENNNLNDLFKYLQKHKIGSIIVEGGAKTINYFIQKNIWDEARVIIGDVNFKDGLKAPELKREYKSQKKINKDILHTYLND